MSLPVFPEAVDYLWGVYHRLRGRKGGAMGIEPIAWGDIDAFCRLSGLRLAPWEVRVVEALDDVFIETYARTPGETIAPDGASEQEH